MANERLSLRIPPAVLQQVPTWLRELYAQLMSLSGRLLFGFMDGTVTLTVSAASTVKTEPRIGSTDRVLLIPTTENAKLEMEGKLVADSAGAWVSTVANGSFTISHANHAAADRTFAYVIFRV